jgi:hypothetical protein
VLQEVLLKPAVSKLFSLVIVMASSKKIYNRKTGRYIANTSANRKRIGLKPRKSSKKSSRKGSRKASKKGSRKVSKKGTRKGTRAKPTKGDCKCYYKGSEPSPKGKGYCAHCGNLGTEKVGTDGMKWKIKKRANGSLYWAKMK